MLHFDDDVQLYSYRNEQTFSGSAALTISKALYGASEVGSSHSKEDRNEQLVNQLMSNPAMRDIIDTLLEEVYQKAREGQE